MLQPKQIWVRSGVVLLLGMTVGNCLGDNIGFEGVNGTLPVNRMEVADEFQNSDGVRFVSNGVDPLPSIAERGGGVPGDAFGTVFGNDEIDPGDPSAQQVGQYFLDS